MVISKFPQAIQRNLPLLSFVVASGALSFQILVLYPWHTEIDKSHHDLSTKIEKLTLESKTLQQHQQQLQLQQQQQVTHIPKISAEDVNSTNTISFLSLTPLPLTGVAQRFGLSRFSNPINVATLPQQSKMAAVSATPSINP